MHRGALSSHAALGTLFLLFFATCASAQTAGYITGTAFADIKQFDSIQYDPLALITSTGTSLDGTAAGGGLRVGTFLHPLWSLEIGVEAEARTTTAFPNPYAEILALYPTSLSIPELSGSTSFLTVNTVIGFHPAKSGRVRLGYLGGFSFVRGTYQSTIPDFGIATGDFSFGPASMGASAFTGMTSRTITLPNFEVTTLSRRDNAAGGVLGFEAAVDITGRLAIVPGIRAIVFGNQGQSVFLIRPEVGMRWNF